MYNFSTFCAFAKPETQQKGKTCGHSHVIGKTCVVTVMLFKVQLVCVLLWFPWVSAQTLFFIIIIINHILSGIPGIGCAFKTISLAVLGYYVWKVAGWRSTKGKQLKGERQGKEGGGGGQMATRWRHEQHKASVSFHFLQICSVLPAPNWPVHPEKYCFNILQQTEALGCWNTQFQQFYHGSPRHLRLLTLPCPGESACRRR